MLATRLMAEYDAETTTYSTPAGAAKSGNFTPDFSGTLIGLRIMNNRSAASSLINHIQYRLTSTTFRPNTIEVGFTGSGLQTAPAVAVPPVDWQVEQPVAAGVPISIEARNVTADTPVTVSNLLYGIFRVS